LTLNPSYVLDSVRLAPRQRISNVMEFGRSFKQNRLVRWQLRGNEPAV
jgi:hypothetical protein